MGQPPVLALLIFKCLEQFQTRESPSFYIYEFCVDRLELIHRVSDVGSETYGAVFHGVSVAVIQSRRGMNGRAKNVTGQTPVL